MEKRYKRLLIIAPDFPPPKGGVEKFVASLVSKLPRSIFQIRVLAGTRINKALRVPVEENRDDIIIRRIPTISIKGIDFPRRIEYYIDIWRNLRWADIVHLNDVRCFFTTIILGRIIYRFKLVLTTHGFIFHTKRFKEIKKIYSYFFILCVRIFCHRVVANGIVDFCYCQKNKLNTVLINNGILLDRWKEVNRAPQQGEFLYFGRIDSNKNLQTLVRSLSYFASQCNKFHLAICGTGSPKYLISLKKTVIECGLSDSISFMGSVSDEKLLDYLGRAEFVFLPSTFESFGYTLVEALAAGATVIAQKNKQFEHMIEDGAFAYLIDMSDEEVFVNTIKEARRHYLPMRKDAIEFVSKYDEKVTAKKYVDIFNPHLRLL